MLWEIHLRCKKHWKPSKDEDRRILKSIAWLHPATCLPWVALPRMRNWEDKWLKLPWLQVRLFQGSVISYRHKVGMLNMWIIQTFLIEPGSSREWNHLTADTWLKLMHEKRVKLRSYWVVVEHERVTQLTTA